MDEGRQMRIISIGREHLQYHQFPLEDRMWANYRPEPPKANKKANKYQCKKVSQEKGNQQNEQFRKVIRSIVLHTFFQIHIIFPFYLLVKFLLVFLSLDIKTS